MYLRSGFDGEIARETKVYNQFEEIEEMIKELVWRLENEIAQRIFREDDWRALEKRSKEFKEELKGY